MVLCDACGGACRAVAEIRLPSGLSLFMCAHHTFWHKKALEAAGAQIDPL